MSNSKVIIDFSGSKDNDISIQASTILSACTGNANFNFTGNALANVESARTAYNEKLQAVSLGGTLATAAKEEAKKALINALRTLCQQINLQANGDIVKLQSSGVPLAQEASIQVMPMASKLEVNHTSGISGSVNASVEKPNVTDHGTLFAYAEKDTAPANINDWKIIHSNSHKLTIKGLKTKTDYLFSAAYKGRDGDDLAWCPSITITVI